MTEITGEVSSQQRAEALKGLDERKAAAATLEQQKVAPPPAELQGHKGFVAAREYANATFLVKPGKPVPTPIVAGMPVGIQPLARREGDVWASFNGGVLVTDDPVIIQWCLDHPKVCRPSDDPMTKGWATIKDMQARLSNRDPIVDSSQLDADETFPPDMMERLASQAQAAKVGSPGADAVDAAETIREVTARREAERAADTGRLVP